MALNERQRQRIRSALEATISAEDAVAAVADERARTGPPDADADLDRAAGLIRELIVVLERLTKP